MLGVLPGQTLWDDAKDHLTDVDPGTQRIEVNVADQVRLTIFPSVEESVVGRGFLASQRGSDLPVGWALLHYGPPCKMVYYPNTRMLSLRYSDADVNLSASGRVTLYTTIDAIHWRDPHFQSTMQPDPCTAGTISDVVSAPWAGLPAVRWLQE